MILDLISKKENILMVQLISIIFAFLIIYTLFKTRETSNSSRKLRMLVYTFLGIIFLLGLVSVVLGTYGLLNSITLVEIGV